jgi:hypothetical protein
MSTIYGMTHNLVLKKQSIGVGVTIVTGKMKKLEFRDFLDQINHSLEGNVHTISHC